MTGQSPTVALVRGNVFPTMLTAGVLLVFGHFVLAEPTGTDLFSRANWWFYQAVRWGGLALLIIGAWSMLGSRWALLADGVTSLAVGGTFLITGLLMWSDGGSVVQVLFNGLFGLMLLHEARRSQSLFVALRVVEHIDATVAPFDARPRQADEWTEVEPRGEAPSLGSTLRERRSRAASHSDAPDAGAVVPIPTSTDSPADGTEASSQDEAPPDEEADDEPAPSGGFLASFASPKRKSEE